jgi:hypothetical protein
MMRIAIAVLIASLPSPSVGQVINPAVIQANIAKTVCASGWTATVRPPTSYTRRIKLSMFTLAQSNGGSKEGETIDSFELDHITPIVLGGHPRDRLNLQLQRWNGPNGAYAKDAVERYLARRVCANQVTLAEAQRCISHNWRKCAPSARSTKIEKVRTE